MEIDIINETSNQDIVAYSTDFPVIASKISLLLQLEDDLQCAVVFVDDEQMRQINSQYRGIDRTTDVISFALKDQSDDYETNPEIDKSLGDIIINIQAVQRQATEYKHSQRRETLFLFTHGLLHLLGYDHQSATAEKIMINLQKEILNEIAK